MWDRGRQRLQGPHDILSVASSCAYVLLANIGPQLIQDIRYGLNFGVDRLFGLAPTLVRFAERTNDPELTNSSRDGEEVLHPFNLSKERLVIRILRNSMAVWIIRVFGFLVA